MKQLLFSLFFSSIMMCVFAQLSEPQRTITYPMALDANFYGVDIPEAAVYFREFSPNSGSGPAGFVRDYHYSGILQAEGGLREGMTSDNPYELKKEGVYYWYFPNGNISTIAYFISNKADGKYSMFYENGALKEEGYYSNGLLNGDCYTYFENGKKKSYSRYNAGEISNKSYEEYAEDGTRSVVFVEKFSTAQNSYGWITGDYQTYSGEIVPGAGLKLKNKDYNRMGFHLQKPEVLTGTPFSYGSVMTSNSGDADSYFGLTFDFNDWENYKYFVISDKGYFAVGQYIDGNNTYLVGPSYTAEIKKAESLGGYMINNQNLIEMTNVNGKTRFSINNQVVNASLPVFTGYGQFGLYVESGIKTVTFNSFYIKSK